MRHAVRSAAAGGRTKCISAIERIAWSTAVCGIVGLYLKSPEKVVSESLLMAMNRAIVHRGPDGEGVFVDGPLGMAMRRLAIIDIAGGAQPMFNESGDIAVVFNGEIFNHGELRRELIEAGHTFRTRSDTETLVHGYECWGESLPSRLNGMFAFSLWDRRSRKLLIARDHIGVKPLYVYEDDECLAWASEIKALLKLPMVRRELDPEGLLDFLRFGYVPMPRTMFRRIRKLPPASLLSVSPEGIRQQEYWTLSFEPDERTEAEWCDEIRALLDDSVRRQLMSDVPLGAFLSGGIDSSAIVSTMRHLGVDRINTYAIGFGAEDSFHNELSKAAAVARQFETNHHEILVDPDVADLMPQLVAFLDEPMTDTSFLVTYLVSRLARETVTVILSGIGGDELFAGYRRYLGPRLQSWYGKIPQSIRQQLIRPVLNRLPVDRGSRIKSALRHARGFANAAEQPEPGRYQDYVSIFGNGDRTSILTSDYAALEQRHLSNHVAAYYQQAPSECPINRMFYADLKTSLVDSLLTFTDKMSMAVSLEARVPLLDYRMVELAARIPGDVRLSGMAAGGLKHIFKQAVAPRLPRSVIDQRKQGFGTPISRWFRGRLRPLLEDYLAEERVRRRGYFSPAAIRRLIDDHQHQRADNSEHLLALLTFELWHTACLD